MIDDLEPTDQLPAENLPAGPDANFLLAKAGAELLDGTALQPWSPIRKVAAQSMGMLWPVIGDEGQEQLGRTGLYPGALRDTIIFLWLCASDTQAKPTKENPAARAPLAQSEIQRATRKPGEAWDQALRWAETHDLVDMDSPAFGEGYRLFMQKMTAELSARVRPDLPADKSATSSDPNA